jgi:hypothetical protein
MSWDCWDTETRADIVAGAARSGGERLLPTFEAALSLREPSVQIVQPSRPF